MSNDLGGRRPRPSAPVSRAPMGSGVAIAVTAVALVFGFLILHKVNDDGGSGSVTPGGGGGDDAATTVPIDTGFLDTTPTTTPGDFTSTKVQVANCSIQNGVARMMSSALADSGFQVVDATNGTCDPKLTKSYVIFNVGTAGAEAVANTVARTLGGLPVEQGNLPIKVESGAWAEGSGVVLLLGNDLAGKTLEQIQTGTTAATVPGSTPTS